MTLLIWTLVLLFIGALGTVLLALSVPWVVSCVVSTKSDVQSRFEVRPFSQAFPFPIRVSSKKNKADKSDAAPDQGVPQKRRKIGSKMDAKRVRRILAHAPELLAGILQAFRFEQVHLRARLGLADPADTGALFGAILPMSSTLAPSRIHLEVEPDFSRAILDGDLRATIRIHAIRSLPAMIRFGWCVFVRSM